nr:MAG TPA: Epidermal patterning factor-like protein [Bacteriophage sp.]DAV45827.1 MAG TPA: Epidermal patterning factor-like protein [Bacteriophage sp.]
MLAIYTYIMLAIYMYVDTSIHVHWRCKCRI